MLTDIVFVVPDAHGWLRFCHFQRNCLVVVCFVVGCQVQWSLPHFRLKSHSLSFQDVCNNDEEEAKDNELEGQEQDDIWQAVAAEMCVLEEVDISHEQAEASGCQIFNIFAYIVS